MIAGLTVVATIGLNASIWMRHKSLAAARGDWHRENLVSALSERLVSPAVIDAVLAELSTYYSAGLIPRPDDDLGQLLRIDAEEMEFIVERLFQTLALPTPSSSDPEVIPPIGTVEDLAVYVQDRFSYFANRPAAAL